MLRIAIETLLALVRAVGTSLEFKVKYQCHTKIRYASIRFVNSWFWSYRYKKKINTHWLQSEMYTVANIIQGRIVKNCVIL